MIKLSNKWYVSTIELAHLDGDNVIVGTDGLRNPQINPLFLVEVWDPDSPEIQSIQDGIHHNSARRWSILTDGEKCWYLCNGDLDPRNVGMSSLGTCTINYSFYPAITDDTHKVRIREQIKHFMEEQTGV